MNHSHYLTNAALAFILGFNPTVSLAQKSAPKQLRCQLDIIEKNGTSRSIPFIRLTEAHPALPTLQQSYLDYTFEVSLLSESYAEQILVSVTKGRSNERILEAQVGLTSGFLPRAEITLKLENGQRTKIFCPLETKG